MLFDDSEVLSADELNIFDSQAQAIAQAEGVTLDGPQGLIRRVVDECGAILLARANTASSWHTGRLGWLGGASITCGLRLNQVVVGGKGQMHWSPVRSWIAQRVLSAFYQAVQTSSKGEQYRKKAELFAHEARKRYWPIVEQSGLPCVRTPLMRPGADRTTNSGDWTLSPVAGNGLEGQYDVALTYVRQSDGAESSPSEISRIALQTAQGILVSIDGLRPAAGATHWNVYSGSANGGLQLQNDAPLSLSVNSFSFSPMAGGADMGDGQQADFISPLPEISIRA